MAKYPTFLSTRAIADLHKTIRQGYATMQEFQDPQPIVQIRRMDTTTGRYVDLGLPVRLIQISFGLRELKEQGGAITESNSDGDISYWADELALKVGDRFSWDGQVCEISAVYPEQFGVVQAEVNLQQ